MGREAATSNSEAKGDLDGDLYQDHPVADHFVASVVIDLLPCPMLNAFDDAKDGDQVETKSGFDADDPPASLMEYQSGTDTEESFQKMLQFHGDLFLEPSHEGAPDLVVHTIDFVEAYHHVQVAIMLMTLDDGYNHPDPIQRDKWHTAIERELQMTMWKSSPSLVGIAEGADHFTMKMPDELYWMLVKKFIWKDKSMDKSVKE